MGDSAITETFGVGGMAMIAAPAVTRFVGAGGYEDALRTSNEMMEIVIDRNPNFTVPTWNFQGICLGIDARKVVEKGITPVINTGIAHKIAGYGQIGAGTVHPPIECFEKAITGIRKEAWLRSRIESDGGQVMEKKKVVIALGGNALGNNIQEQKEAVAKTAQVIVDLAAQGLELVVTHGNGPQVGMIQKAMDELATNYTDNYMETPLPTCCGHEPGIYRYRSAECDQI